MMQIVEERRKDAFRSFQYHRGSVKAATKRYIKETISQMSNMKPRQVLGDIKIKISSSQKVRIDRENLLVELAKRTQMNGHNTKHNSIHVQSFISSVRETFNQYQWFDKRCENVILLYAILHAVDNLSDASISVLPSYAPYLRTVKVGDSKISDYVLQEISKDMYYSVRVKEQLALEPLHKELKIHEQHKQVSPITVTYKFSQRNLS